MLRSHPTETLMMPATALDTLVALHGQRLDTTDERLKAQDGALLRIEKKLDDLKDGWNLRLIGAMAASIAGLLGVVWSFLKTK